MSTLPVDEITVGERHRRDLGDLSELVGVDRGGWLVASAGGDFGWEACRGSAEVGGVPGAWVAPCAGDGRAGLVLGGGVAGRGA